MKTLPTISSSLPQSHKKFYTLTFLSFFIIVIGSILSSPFLQTSQFSNIPRNTLSRRLNNLPTRFLSEETSKLSGDTLIGTIDTFATDPKFLKLEIFDETVKDQMIINCYLNASCYFQQVIKIQNDLVYLPKVEELKTHKLPAIWKQFSLLNLLVQTKSEKFSDFMLEAFKKLEAFAKAVLSIKKAAELDIRKFIEDIYALIADKYSGVKEEILLQLNDLNSDLSLQFQNILANSFNIIVGLYLQEISNDYLYFDSKLQNLMTLIQSDISANMNQLASYSNQMKVLENIAEIGQKYSELCDYSIKEFLKYSKVRDNWTMIINAEIKTQIIDKFHFPDEKITVAVQNFLTLILENRRNLISQTGSLIFQQLDQYTGVLASRVTTNNQTVQNKLTNLKNFILNCNCSTSNDLINSIFVDDADNNRFFSDYEVDAMGKLKNITSKEFQKTLDEFERLFIEYISNLPGIKDSIKKIFAEKYSDLLIKLNSTKSEGAENVIMLVSDLWDDLKNSSLISQNMLEKIKQNKTIEELSDEELAIIKQYNIFNDTIISTFKKIKDNLAEINGLSLRILDLYNEKIKIDSFNLSLNILGEEIYNNITALIKEQLVQKCEEILLVLLREAEQYLGFKATDDPKEFLMELVKFTKENYDLANRIIQAVLTQDFSQIENLAEYLKMKFSGVFNKSFLDYFSENPLEFQENQEEKLFNISTNGMQSHLTLTKKYHHTVKGYYGIKSDGFLISFFFKITPFVEFNLHIVNKLQEFYILRQVLTTSVDFLNGTFPIAYSLNFNFTEGNKNIKKILNKKVCMNMLNLKVSQTIAFFLAHSSNAEDPILMDKNRDPAESEIDETENVEN